MLPCDQPRLLILFLWFSLICDGLESFDPRARILVDLTTPGEGLRVPLLAPPPSHNTRPAGLFNNPLFLQDRVTTGYRRLSPAHEPNTGTLSSIIPKVFTHFNSQVGKAFSRFLRFKKSDSNSQTAFRFFLNSADSVIHSSTNDEVKLAVREFKKLKFDFQGGFAPNEGVSPHNHFITQTLQLLDSGVVEDQHEWLWLHGAFRTVSDILHTGDGNEPLYNALQTPRAAVEIALLARYGFRDKIGLDYSKFLKEPLQDSELMEISRRGELAKEAAQINLESAIGDTTIIEKFHHVLDEFSSIPPMGSGELNVQNTLLESAKAFITDTRFNSESPVKDIMIKILTHCARFSRSFETALDLKLTDSSSFFDAIIGTELKLTLKKIEEMSKLKPFPDADTLLKSKNSMEQLTQAARDALHVIGSDKDLEIQFQVYRLNSLLDQLNPHVQPENTLISQMQQKEKFFQGVVTIWRRKYSGINLRDMPPFSFEYRLLKNEKILAAADSLAMTSQWPKDYPESKAFIKYIKSRFINARLLNWDTSHQDLLTPIMMKILPYFEKNYEDPVIKRVAWEAIAIVYTVDDMQCLLSVMSAREPRLIRLNRLFRLAKDSLDKQESLSDSQRRTIIPFAEALKKMKDKGEIHYKDDIGH